MERAAIEAAPAKVNLSLHVTGRRSDGYHELDSLVVFAALGDELIAAPSAADSLTVTGPFAERLTGDGTNLVMRAVTAFRQRWPDHVRTGLAIELRKNLPVAAGLGGGSADAAAALRLMDGLGRGGIGNPQLSELAQTLGADVPACLLSRPCRATGIGQVVEPLRHFPAFHLVLVNPLVPVITADVFRRLRIAANPPPPPLPEDMAHPALLGMWLEETRNDLEAPAIEMLGSIRELIDGMRAAQGCVLARMSGSGATVFGLFGSSAQAHQAAHDCRQRWPSHWVAAAPVILADA